MPTVSLDMQMIKQALRMKLSCARQLPIEHWHGWIGDATIADAILDRLTHHHHRITIEGDSLRRQPARPRHQEKKEAANP
jgi:DNA replication protein DnaC